MCSNQPQMEQILENPSGYEGECSVLSSHLENMNISNNNTFGTKVEGHEEEEEEEEQQQQQQQQQQNLPDFIERTPGPYDNYYYYYYDERLHKEMNNIRQDLHQLITIQSHLLEMLREKSRQFPPYITRSDFNNNIIIINEGNGNSGYVIGHQGNTLLRLQQKYPDIHISVPRSDDQNRHIYIHNCNKSNFNITQACAHEIINLLSIN